MKNLSLIFVALFGLVIFASCEDDLGPVANSDPGAPTITSPESGDSFVLTEDEADDMLTMEWSKPDFGFDAAATYTVEMAMEGTDFDSPTEIAEVNDTSLEISVEEMNNTLLSAGLPADQESGVEIRVAATASDSVDESTTSDPVAVSYTPYFVEVDYPSVYVPGDYQSSSGYGSDFEPADAPALYSPDDNDEYEGYVYMANDGALFKITPERSFDEGDYGSDNNDGTLNEGTLDNNIEVENSGYYKINVDLNDMTYELLDTEWGVLGDATPNGWESDDHDMEYDSDEKVWSVELELTEGELKFRANDTWDDIDYGDNDGDGTLDAGGDNIVVEEAGTYTIEMDLSQQPYRYTLIQE